MIRQSQPLRQPSIPATNAINPPDVVTIDVPIGLTDRGPRECDRLARKYLKAPRASSVFPAPIRPVLEAATYEKACKIREEIDGRKISKQLWAILPKIKEVDTFLREDPARHKWIREIHPEICFWAWNNNKATLHNKKSPKGRAEREALVKTLYGDSYTRIQSDLPQGWYANDDLLDAFAALWSAERVVSGKAMVLPEIVPVDSCGLRMEMVA